MFALEGSLHWLTEITSSIKYDAVMFRMTRTNYRGIQDFWVNGEGGKSVGQWSKYTIGGPRKTMLTINGVKLPSPSI